MPYFIVFKVTYKRQYSQYEIVDDLEEFLKDIRKVNQSFICSKNGEWTDDEDNVVGAEVLAGLCQCKYLGYLRPSVFG